MRISHGSSDVVSADLTCSPRGPKLPPGPDRRDTAWWRSGRESAACRQTCHRSAARTPTVPSARETSARQNGEHQTYRGGTPRPRSEEHTSELQSLMRISYAVFCLKKKTHKDTTKYH